jgi:D-alanyl-lipoteichoic acid acyltransferase DltB (MBOAT superfamily)
MEFVQHFMYVVAIKDAKAWVGDSPSQIGMIGFWSLMVVWLKVFHPSHYINIGSYFYGEHSCYFRGDFSGFGR